MANRKRTNIHLLGPDDSSGDYQEDTQLLPPKKMYMLQQQKQTAEPSSWHRPRMIPQNQSDYTEHVGIIIPPCTEHREGSMREMIFGSQLSSDESDNSDHLEIEEDVEEKTETSSSATSNNMEMQDNSKASMYSDFAQKMMAKMGHKEGKGLGKHGEGRVDIVTASTQRGRRGLGLKKDGFEASDDLIWDEREEISVYETVTWVPACTEPIPKFETMREWMSEGKRKTIIEDETNFCNEDILQRMLKAKTVFDTLEPEEMRQARTRSNPFETIRGGIFLNRAAMKMANMDPVFDFMFTNPTNESQTLLTAPTELFFFADICAGPGGFSEYVLWRKKHHTKGFGFTLKGGNDFKLEDFFAASPEFFEPYYGVDGKDGDGDIMKADNLKEFQRFVLENTDGKGVHLVMADGGFSVEGQENLQEVLTKQLLLCQFLCALSILRVGGNFVCKTFDLFTPFSVGLIYLLYLSFEKVNLFKPITSRPANSERYVVCKGCRSGSIEVHKYMFYLNDRLNELKDSDIDVLEAVPMNLILEDTGFTDYIVEQNERQAEQQIQALAKIQAFVRNNNLSESKQAETRDECLKLWGIPDRTRSAPKIPDPDSKFENLIKEKDNKHDNQEYLHSPVPLLDSEKLSAIKSLFDYRCLVSGGERLYIMGVGRSHVFKCDVKFKKTWTKFDNCNLQLPGDTLFEAELVQELKGEGSGQRRITSIHIVDCMWLGGEDVRLKHFTERIQKASLFVRSITKTSRQDLTPVRVKEVFRLEHADQIFQRLEMRVVKGSRIPRLCFRSAEDCHFLPAGLHFIKITHDPWSMNFSRSQNRKYFFNSVTNESLFECPPDSIASFRECRKRRILWKWEVGVAVHDGQHKDKDKLSKVDILTFVEHKIPKQS